MTRKDIYIKIQRMLATEKDILLTRYEAGNLSYDNYQELIAERVRDYREWEIELMLANDDEVSDRLRFIIDYSFME